MAGDMSRIQIECDGCGKRVLIPVRQNHEARDMLVSNGWTNKDKSGRHGTRKEDYCPECAQ